jgi:L-rhamnose mutarotase
MQRRAFWARLNPGCQDEYIEAHRNMPRELGMLYRKAGIQDLHIYQHGELLFLYLECEDVDAVMASLENSSMEREWQKLISPMLDGGDSRALTAIFQLP